MVPSAFDTWVTATMRVRGLSSFWYSSMRSSPERFMGMTRSLAPVSSQSICQGTMLEWCSMAEMTISSPLWSVWDKPSNPASLQALGEVQPGYDVDDEGEGDIIRVTGQTQTGKRMKRG